MTVLGPDDRTTFEMHGAQFHSYVAPGRGSRELCAWRTEVAPRSAGAAHTVSHEEVFLVLDGRPTITVDDRTDELVGGDVVFVPVGATLRLDNEGPEPAALWVTTSVGLTATTPAGDRIEPPWAR